MTDYPDPNEPDVPEPPRDLVDDTEALGDLADDMAEVHDEGADDMTEALGDGADDMTETLAEAPEDRDLAAEAEPEPAVAASPTADSGSQQAGTPPPGYQPPPRQQQQPYVAGTPRRLYRSNHDRKLGGVSAGIAEYFGIDPTIIRLFTLAIAISGVGILVYLAAWFIVPERPHGLQDPRPPKQPKGERTVSFAFGIMALAVAFGIVTESWTVLSIALIGGGIWLLSEHSATPVVAAAGPAAAASAPPAFVDYQPAPQSQPAAFAGSPVSDMAPPGYYDPPEMTARAPEPEPSVRYPQKVTWVVFSLLALLLAVGIAASAGDWWNVSAARFLGVGVVIIGIGVVVGQLRGGGRRGGARGLIPLGILAALALFPVSAVDGLLDEGIGETRYRPTTIAELQDSYQHGIGSMTVDLSNLDLEGQSRSVDIDLGIGELIVIVSETAGGTAVLDVNAGEIAYQRAGSRSFDYDDGVNVETSTLTLQGANGELDLNIHVGFGASELRIEGN